MLRRPNAVLTQREHEHAIEKSWRAASLTLSPESLSFVHGILPCLRLPDMYDVGSYAAAAYRAEWKGMYLMQKAEDAMLSVCFCW
jgi:hypothetical protein